MFIFNIGLGWRKFKRVMQIIFLVLGHLIGDWFTNTRIYRFFRREARNKEEAHERTTPARLRTLIENLGPTFIKFGQILADRPDLISEKFRRELKKLQATARPFADSGAMELIEGELGGPIELFFQEFGRTCIASASIGQVYVGRLKNGDKVIVKIQRPGIYSKIQIDLLLMKILARKLVKRYPELASLNLLSFLDEFGDSLIKEMNYNNEASNVLRFRELMKDEPSFYAPRIYTEYTTKRLLVMEFIEGIPPDETEKLRSLGYDLNVIAENGAHILLKMILRHGVFHADPHAGNIFILPGNRVCFIDFGMVAVLRPKHIQFLADFTIGFATKKPAKITNALLDLCGKKFFPYEEDLRFEVEEVIKRYSYIPIDTVDISSILMDCISLIVKYELQIPSNIYMLLKALATIQKFAVDLSPNFNISRVLMPYARDVVLQQFNPRRLVRGVTETVSDYINLVRDLPGEISQILYKAKEGKLVHEISIKQDKRLRKTLRITSINFGLGFSSALLLVCSTIVYTSGRDPQIARVGFIIGLVMGGWLFLRSVRRSLPD